MYPRVPQRAGGGQSAGSEAFDPSAGVAAHDPYASQHYVPRARPPPQHQQQQRAQEHTSSQRVTLLPSEDGGELDEAIVEVSLDGINFYDPSFPSRIKRSIPLHELAQWDASDPTALTLTHRSPRGDCLIPLTAKQQQIRSIAESLTLHCLQLCDMHGTHPGELAGMKASGIVTNPLAPSTSHSHPDPMRETTHRPSSSTTTFGSLHDHLYAGWLYKRGEHMALWRRRWFVLKHKTLYWFKNADVSYESEPRGHISLLEAGACKGSKPRCLEIFGTEATKAGCNLLYADSEKECDEWLNAIQAAAKGRSNGRRASAANGNAAELSSASDRLAERLHSGESSKSNTSQLQHGLEHINVQNKRAAASTPSAPSVPHRPPPMPTQSFTPSAPAPPSRPPPQPPQGDWRVAHAPDGRPYYYDLRTNRVQWERPPGF